MHALVLATKKSVQQLVPKGYLLTKA